MRIAVVGAGIAGLGAAWLLSREHDVVLFESDHRLGGHTHTHAFEQAGTRYAIDSGFIVFNTGNYPLLTRLFGELGVETQATTMSFAVSSERSGIEYDASTIAGLFHRRRNLVSPRFWRMLADIRRFYREAPRLLDAGEDGPDLGEYLASHRYGEGFVLDHLIPMVAALWSSPPDQALRFPAKYLVRFMANHRMLSIDGRPEWRVVRGGSASYVRAMSADWPVHVRLGCPVRRVLRQDSGVLVSTEADEGRYDHVVIACHADQALALLPEATPTERAVLGAMPYRANDAILHTDARILPSDPRNWAAWNVRVPRGDATGCSVSYCMNLLQSIQSPSPFVVTLGDGTESIDPDKVLARMRYHHPVYTHRSVAALARRSEIDGVDRISYAGAYWGWGFHEDGLRSAVDVAASLGVRWE